MKKNQKSGKMKSKLPKWFDGQRYTEGDIVTNPFSGEDFYLNRDELSKYDFLKGSEYTLMIPQQQLTYYLTQEQHLPTWTLIIWMV